MNMCPSANGGDEEVILSKNKKKKKKTDPAGVSRAERSVLY